MTTATITRVDREIQHDILAELDWEPRLHPNEIGVVVQEGVVALTGWVDTYAKKWAAERAAHRVSRVRAVANDIEVRLPSGAHRSDADIATAAVRSLEWDAFVPVDRVELTVSNGWLVLRGDVEWEYQRRAAERSVRRLIGVRGVTNGIALRPRTKPAPDELRQRIGAALVRTVQTDAGRIEVRVDGERVILSGTVRSSLEREEAERVAWSAPGVTQVDNQIALGR